MYRYVNFYRTCQRESIADPKPIYGLIRCLLYYYYDAVRKSLEKAMEVEIIYNYSFKLIIGYLLSMGKFLVTIRE